MESYTIRTSTPTATQAVGQALGQCLTAGMVVALSGELGAGKTTLTQGIAQGMGVTAPVTSPTFTLVNEYAVCQSDSVGLRRLIHIDSYRLGEVDADAALEAATFGFEEMIDAEYGAADSVVIIEWAERLQSLLPADYLHVSLYYPAEDEAVEDEIGEDDAARAIQLQANGPTSAAIVAQLRTWHGHEA